MPLGCFHGLFVWLFFFLFIFEFMLPITGILVCTRSGSLFSSSDNANTMKKTLVINDYARLTLSPNGCWLHVWPHGADTVVRLVVTTTGVVRWRAFAHLSTHLSAEERYYVQVAVQEHSADSITSLSQVG